METIKQLSAEKVAHIRHILQPLQMFFPLLPDQIQCLECRGQGHYDADECDRRMSRENLSCHVCYGNGKQNFGNIRVSTLHEFLRRVGKFQDLLGAEELDTNPIVEDTKNWYITNVGTKVSNRFFIKTEVPTEVKEQFKQIQFEGTGWVVKADSISLNFLVRGNIIPKSEEQAFRAALTQANAEGLEILTPYR